MPSVEGFFFVMSPNISTFALSEGVTADYLNK